MGRRQTTVTTDVEASLLAGELARSARKLLRQGKVPARATVGRVRGYWTVDLGGHPEIRPFREAYMRTVLAASAPGSR